MNVISDRDGHDLKAVLSLWLMIMPILRRVVARLVAS